MSKKNYGGNSVPTLIVLLSAVCMLLLLAVFFGTAKRNEDNRQPKDSEKTDSVSSDEARQPQDTGDTDSRTQDIADTDEPKQEPSDTDEPKQEPSDTDEPKQEPSDTDKPASEEPHIDIPDKIPSDYDEALLSAVALKEAAAPADYIDRLIFFGDSTTYGMKHYKVFGSYDTKQVWTPSSGTLALFRALTDLIYDPNKDAELSLADICATEKPEYLIMTLGVNGVSFMDEGYFKTEYQNVINTILASSPNTKLILQSIYPVARSYANQNSINNKKIQEANKWIVEIASAYKLPYLNTYSALVGDDGYMPESYQNGDGMHLNEVGFGVIIDYVRSHPYLG